jgi:hypothetical protein
MVQSSISSVAMYGLQSFCQNSELQDGEHVQLNMKDFHPSLGSQAELYQNYLCSKLFRETVKPTLKTEAMILCLQNS